MIRSIRVSCVFGVALLAATVAPAQDDTLDTVYEGKTLRTWGAELESDDRAVSENASIHLIMLGKRAVPLLTKALKSPKAKVRGTAGQALSMLGKKAAAAAPALTSRLRSENDPQARAWLASALGDVGATDVAAIAALRATLEKEGEFPQRMAVRSLGMAGPKAASAVPELIALLESESSPLREEVRAALGAIGEGAAAAVPELTRLLDAGDRSDREAAASTLGRIGLPALAALEAALRHGDAGVRRQAARGLGRMGPAAGKALPALIEMLREDDDEYARYAAVTAIGSVGGARKEAIDALTAALGDEKLEQTAAAALGGLGVKAKAAAPELEKLLASKRRHSRTMAALALVEMGAAGPELVEPLADAVVSTAKPRYRAPAAQALGELGPVAKQAVPALEKSLKTAWDPAFKTVIKAALAKIGEGPKEAAAPAAPLGDPQRAAALVAEFVQDTQGNERYRIASALVKEGPQAAFPALASAIEAQKDPRLKNALLELVRNFRDVSPEDGALVVPLAAKILGGDDVVFVRQAAARVLGALESPDAVPALLDALENQTDSTIVYHSALALGRLGSKAAVAAPVLSSKISESLDQKRAPGDMFVTALGQVGGERDVALLVRVLREQPRSGTIAAQALHAMGPKAAAAAPALAEALQTEGALLSLRQEAAAALADLGPGAAGASAVLFELLDTEQDRRVLNSVIAAIGKLPIPTAERAVPKLVAQITGRKPGGAAAAYALSDLGARSPATIAQVGAALNGADPSVAFNLLSLLGRTRHAAATPFLSAALQGEDERLRILAAKGLWQIGPKASGAIPALRQALRDPSLNVKLRASAAALRVSGRLVVPTQAPAWDIEAVAKQITKDEAVLAGVPSLERASGLGRRLAEGYGLAKQGTNASDLALLELLTELFWEHEQALTRAAEAALK